MDKDFWDLILKALALAAGAIASFFQIRNLLPRSRSTLKTDLEILRLLDPTDPNYAVVRAQIDATVKATYRTDEGRFRVYNWTDLIWGTLLFVLMTMGLLYVFREREGFTWWYVSLGLLWMAGLGGMISGLERPAPTASPRGDKAPGG